MRIGALALGVAAIACGDSLAPESAAFAINRAKWSAKAIGTYTFEYHRSCGECQEVWAATVRITVVDGEVAAVNRVPTGEPDSFPGFRVTIDSLFEEVGHTLERKPYRLMVAYDHQFGYPSYVSVDYDQQMVDDEGGFFVRFLSPGH
jgi:hypothetical protein